jgi:hypothetical protein
MFGTRDEDEFINDVEAARAYRRGGGTWPALLVAAAGIGAFLAWAAVFEIEEVTSARGRVVPTSEVQVVQSLEGGIVREIAVGEGDLVEAGQVLIEIDDTTAAAERGELLEREAGLLAEAARTEAEAEGRDEIVFPPGWPSARRARWPPKNRCSVRAARSSKASCRCWRTSWPSGGARSRSCARTGHGPRPCWRRSVRSWR